MGLSPNIHKKRCSDLSKHLLTSCVRQTTTTLSTLFPVSFFVTRRGNSATDYGLANWGSILERNKNLFSSSPCTKRLWDPTKAPPQRHTQLFDPGLHRLMPEGDWLLTTYWCRGYCMELYLHFPEHLYCVMLKHRCNFVALFYNIWWNDLF
jgi:hypothetical protein